MLRKLAAGTGVVLVAAGLAATPAVATRLPTTPEESCGDVPHAEQNGLVKVTDPADGSTVDPGDTIDVTLKWSGSLLDAAVLDRALDCVEVDDRPAPGLSLDEQGVPNQSPITHRYRIPSGLAPGTRVCDQGFLFGPPADVPQRLASNRVCFTVGPPASAPPATGPGGRPAPAGPGAASPPTTSPSGPPGSPGPGGSGLPPSGGSGPGGPGSPGPGLPPGGGGRMPSADTSVTVPPPLSPPPPASPPAAATAPAESSRGPAGAPEETTPHLPRTGRDDRPLAAAGGANLIAAGLALIGGARHRRRRRQAPQPPVPPV